MTIDWTLVLFELVNFGVLVLLLSRFVFRPVRRALEQRRADMAERDRQLGEREQAAAGLREQYEGELRRIDRLADERIEAAMVEARTRVEGLIEQARGEAREIVERAETELVAVRRRTLGRFRGEVMSLATEAASRVIRELGAPEVGQAFTRRALHALEDAVGRGRPITGPISLRVSPELDLADVEALVRRTLPGITALHVEPDERVIGGVVLAAAGHEIQSSAGASLEAWYRRLIDEDEQRLAS